MDFISYVSYESYGPICKNAYLISITKMGTIHIVFLFLIAEKLYPIH